MRTLLTSDFFLRFTGGFALGAVALAASQPAVVAGKFAALVGTVAHAV